MKTEKQIKKKLEEIRLEKRSLKYKQLSKKTKLNYGIKLLEWILNEKRK